MGCDKYQLVILLEYVRKECESSSLEHCIKIIEEMKQKVEKNALFELFVSLS